MQLGLLLKAKLAWTMLLFVLKEMPDSSKYVPVVTSMVDAIVFLQGISLHVSMMVG